MTPFFELEGPHLIVTAKPLFVVKQGKPVWKHELIPSYVTLCPGTNRFPKLKMKPTSKEVNCQRLIPLNSKTISHQDMPTLPLSDINLDKSPHINLLKFVTLLSLKVWNEKYMVHKYLWAKLLTLSTDLYKLSCLFFNNWRWKNSKPVLS